MFVNVEFLFVKTQQIKSDNNYTQKCVGTSIELQLKIVYTNAFIIQH